MQPNPDPSVGPIDRRILERAHRTLLHLQGSRLRPEAWDQQMKLVDALDAALHVGDAETVETLATELAVRSGDLVEGIDGHDAVSPAAPYRERIGYLVHALDVATSDILRLETTDRTLNETDRPGPRR